MAYDPNQLPLARQSPQEYADAVAGNQPLNGGQFVNTMASPNQLPLAKPKAAQQPGQIGQPPNTPSYASSVTPLDTRPTDLLAKTIGTPDQTPDRVGLATQAWETFAKASDPYYQKSIRDIGGVEAAKGRIGSGQYRTSLGDAANNRQIQLDTARDTLLNNALTGSIDDAYKNVGIAQQQQGFQAGQQESAYGQALGKAQQQLAEEIGKSNIGVQQGQLQLAKTGQEGAQALQAGELTGTYGGAQTLGNRAQTLAEQATGANLGLEHEKLQLAKTGQEASIGQTQQQIDLAKQQSDIDAAYKSGTLTLAQRNQQLAEIQNQQQFGLEGEKLALAKTGQAASIGQSQQQIDLAKQQADVEAQYKAGTLTLAQRNQQLAELQNSQQFGLEGEKLALAKSGQEAQTEQQKAALALQEKLGLGGLDVEQQKVVIAQKQQEAEQAYQSGQITLAQRDAALKELANAEQFGLEQGKLSLATTGQNADIAAKQRALNIQQQQADIDSQYKAGTLTLAQRNQALAELQNSQQYGLEGSKLALAKDQAADQTRLAEAGLTGRLKTGMDAYGSTTYADTLAKENQALAEAALTGSYTKLDAYGSPVTTPTLAKQQLTQTADQFGASQTQQLQLAKLADATANRQIDVGTAQGKNTLLLELARIMGGPSGNVNPSFILALAQALGVVYTPNGPTIPDGSGGNGGHVGGSGGGDGGMK